MGDDGSNRREDPGAALRGVALSILFALNHAQLPLFSENQNDKFLAGAGAAGVGGLENEWMARTLDPLPLFSAVIEALFRLGAIEGVCVLYAALLGVYLHALVRIGESVLPDLRDSPARIVLLALLFLLHNVYLTSSSEGVAGQYVIGTYFQPSVFGALVLLGISRLLRDDAVSGGLSLGAAVAFHPAYGLAVACVLLGYAIQSARRPRGLRRIAVAAALCALVAGPFVVRAVLLFGATSEETWQKAVVLLSDVRIPNHTLVAKWLDGEAVVRILAMAWLVFAVRGTRLFWMATALFLPVAIGTPVLHLHPDPALRFLTPWRTGALLVPIALAVGSAWVAIRMASRAESHAKTTIRRAALVSIGLLTVVGAIRQVGLVWKYDRAGSMDVIRFAREHLDERDHALVPPGTEELYRFRLETGVPVFVNWKSHPHKDVEVIEWEERITAADRFFRGFDDGQACRRLEELRSRWPVTVVVLPANDSLDACRGPFSELHADERYRLVRLSPPLDQASVREHGSHMETTVELPDEILIEAKKRAAAERRPLRAF